MATQPRPTINMPAVVGVIVVSLAVIVAWVVSGRMGSDQVAISPGTTVVTTTLPGATTVATTAAPSTVPDPTTVPVTASPSTAKVADETTPVPLPSNVPNQGGANGATSTVGAVTTTSVVSSGGSSGGGSSQGSSGGAGDLGISGHPIQQPTCDGAFVTVVASVVGNDVNGTSIKGLLNQYDGAQYLRTDQSCASFAQSQNGEPIYVVYLGPFAQPSDACAARSQGPAGAYVKRLSNDPNAGGANC